ncbi:hypothetical protein U9M48_031217, partial [Paspalum notatum var. saurae]
MLWPSPSTAVFGLFVRHPKALHGAASLLPETSQSSAWLHPLCMSNIPAILGLEVGEGNAAVNLSSLVLKSTIFLPKTMLVISFSRE